MVPVQANIVTIVGHRTELRVNTISVSPLTSEEVQWTGPRGQPLPSGSLDLEQGSSLLVLEDVVLEDSGEYRVNIVRGGVVVASTTISLNVQGEYVRMYVCVCMCVCLCMYVCMYVFVGPGGEVVQLGPCPLDPRVMSSSPTTCR